MEGGGRSGARGGEVALNTAICICILIHTVFVIVSVFVFVNTGSKVSQG